jgi:ketosteroid isomerase-like protein
MSLTPKEVYERQLRLGIAGDRVAQMEYYAPDAVMEAPFAPPGAPARIEGREQILAMSQALDAARPPGMRVVEEQSTLTLHETSDPEVVIAEIDAKVEVPGSDQVIELRQVHVQRIRDGKIVHAKDYYAGHSAAFVQAAMGTSPSA